MPQCDLNAIAARLRPFVERRARPEDVDDVLQEVLVRVHGHFDAIPDDEPFAAFVQRVAANVIVDHHRRRARRDKKHEAHAREADPPLDEGPLAPTDEASRAELATLVGAFVTLVPSPYREALVAVELDGLPMREAAAREGVSEAAMKSRTLRGRRMLRELFEACCEIALDGRGRAVDYAPKPR